MKSAVKKYLPTLFSPLLDRRHIKGAITIVRTSVSRNEISFRQKLFVTFTTQTNKPKRKQTNKQKQKRRCILEKTFKNGSFSSVIRRDLQLSLCVKRPT